MASVRRVLMEDGSGILVVSTPSEPQLVNDKPLDEEPIKAMKLL